VPAPAAPAAAQPGAPGTPRAPAAAAGRPRWLLPAAAATALLVLLAGAAWVWRT
jgi:hypothetical protein